MRRHARIVDLQEEAGVDDRLIFHVHGVGERAQILLVGGVVLVPVVELEVGGRDRGDERLFRRRRRRAPPSGCRCRRDLVLSDIGIGPEQTARAAAPCAWDQRDERAAMHNFRSS